MTAAAKPTVVEALSAVMGDVQAVGKDGRNTQQNYNFRGVDAVVNAVGPALRKHGVVVVPITAEVIEERYLTKSGTAMKGVTATVTFRFYGPAGDHIDAQVCGESSDSGDKAVPKAHSVAYRTMLLQALCIPTDEPDPDAESHERAAQPKKAATTLAGEPPQAAKPRTTAAAPSAEQPSPAMKKKLDVLVGSLREAGHITTEQVYAAVGHAGPFGEDGVLHWSDLRERLTKEEASNLIERLQRFDDNVKAAAA